MFAVGSVLGVVLPPVDVEAADEPVRIAAIRQEDGTGDGRPDLTVIDCAFATDADRIHVVDGGTDMESSSDWRRATDFLNDTWLYDIGRDGSIQLIVRYALEDDRTAAYIYDDRDGDGVVAYRTSGGEVIVDESPYWTARIVSGSRWYLPDGRVNLDVRFELDGPIPTLDRAPGYYIRDFLKHDGIPDVAFEEVADDDGVARYAVRRLLAPAPGDWGFERSTLWSNEGRFPTRLAAPAFFPFLPLPFDPRDPANAEVRYFDLPPSLAVDWTRGTILAARLDGYPTGLGYHLNSNAYIRLGQTNEASFESPHAYYDLAGDGDGYPDMHIRFFTRPPGHDAMWTLPTAKGLPSQAVSYDWNLFGPGTLRWDFKVGVAGNHDIDSTVSFGAFDVRMVPFEELPFWVTERDWKMTTFLAREGEGYESSEGLYEWMADVGDDPQGDSERALEAREATWGYMLGMTTEPPDEYYQSVRLGYRAERRFEEPGRPRLYLSPVDRKLHLVGAETGMSNVNGRITIRYGNLAGGDHFDVWQLEIDGRPWAQLYALDGWLLFADPDTVVIKRGIDEPALLETLPPRDAGEWEAERRRLAAEQADFLAWDLRAMLDGFPGREVVIHRAAVRDVRLTDGGFRFVLDLRPGFRAGDGLLALNELGPGTYVVERDGDFKVQPLTPPRVSASLEPQAATVLRASGARVRIANSGMEDVTTATVELAARGPDGQEVVAATRDVTIASGETIEPVLSWTPAAEGRWLLTGRVRQPDGGLLAEYSAVVGVTLEARLDPASVVGASTGTGSILLISALVISFGLLLGALAWRAGGEPTT